MNVDTDQFLALSGEVDRLGRESAGYAAGRRLLRELVNLLAPVLAACPPDLRLRVITGGGRHVRRRKPGLQLVKGAGR